MFFVCAALSRLASALGDSTIGPEVFNRPDADDAFFCAQSDEHCDRFFNHGQGLLRFQPAFIFIWIGFSSTLFYDRSHIAGPGELSIPFLVDEKPNVLPAGWAGERSGGAPKVP